MQKVKLGIIGLGRLGRHHAENIRYRIPGAELRAVCSVVQEEVDTALKDLQPAYGTSDYRTLLQDKELDGIVIATNSAYHCEMICRAAEAGVLNIYCEKPLGMNQQEIDRIRDTVTRTGVRIFQIGFNRRFDRSIRSLKEKIEGGHIGKPIVIKFLNRDPVWKEEDLLRFSPSSGGLVFDMLTHDYDLARWLIASDAVSVYGNGGVYFYKGLESFGDIDNCTLLVQFRNGVMGFFETSRNSSYGYHVEIEVFGTEGALRMGVVPHRDRVISYTPQGIAQESVRWFFEYWEPTFQTEIQHFVECIAQEKEPEVGLEDGYRAVQWALAAKEAVEKQAIITL